MWTKGCVNDQGWDLKVICTLSVYNFLVLWYWNEYGGGWAEGTVTLGQGDRSGQVCVCECTSVCQHIVPGQQETSQRISVTFSLSIPSVQPFLCPPVPIHITHQWVGCPSITSISYFRITNKNRCGIIHELHWDSVLTLVRNNIHVVYS